MTFEVYDDYQICLDGVWVATVRSRLTATQLDRVKELLRDGVENKDVEQMRLDFEYATEEIRGLQAKIDELEAELEMLR